MLKTCRKSGIAAVVLLLSLLVAVLPGRVSEAAAPAGIAGNGTGGVTIDINAHPYTYYAAMPTWGQYAYTREGCAWFATSRASELTGKTFGQIYSGKTWYNSRYASYGFTRGSQIRENALACYSDHIAVVEKIEGNRVLISEGGMAGYSSAANGYTVLRWRNVSDMGKISSSASHTLLGYVYLDVKQDTQAPVISNVQISDVTSEGYTVSCDITENEENSLVGVVFPTWTERGGQDDLAGEWSGYIGSVTQVDPCHYRALFRVNRSEHNGEYGLYNTYIYAYDKAGNNGGDTTSAVGIIVKEDNGLPFWDIQTGDWYYDSVKYVYENKIMTGLSDLVFGPAASLARAQFTVILHRMEGTPAAAYNGRFPDVPAGSWYADAVLWASENGIVTGYEETGNFGPGDPITREQLAVMFYRYAHYLGMDTGKASDISRFEDAAQVDSFAKEAMEWAVGSGIISGKQNGTVLEPYGCASRAECAVMIFRFRSWCEAQDNIK